MLFHAMIFYAIQCYICYDLYTMLSYSMLFYDIYTMLCYSLLFYAIYKMLCYSMLFPAMLCRRLTVNNDWVENLINCMIIINKVIW